MIHANSFDVCRRKREKERDKKREKERDIVSLKDPFVS